MINKSKTAAMSVAGLLLMAGLPANASNPSSLVYNDGDLLLNFRDTVDGGLSDATVDLGNVTSFMTTVQSLTGQTAVLDNDSGSGFTYSTSAYTPVFSGGTLITSISQPGSGSGDGTADDIGMSAAAENLGATGSAQYTVYLTSQINVSQLASGGTAIGQQTQVGQISTADVIQSIGDGAQRASLGGGGTRFGGASGATFAPDAGLTAEGSGFSYHEQIQDTAGNIDYAGYQSPSTPFEATPATGTVYEALWQVPLQGNGTQTYEGYFTYNPNGEVDYTQVAPVPEPSTYALLFGTLLAGLVIRRQYRSRPV